MIDSALRWNSGKFSFFSESVCRNLAQFFYILEATFSLLFFNFWFDNVIIEPILC